MKEIIKILESHPLFRSVSQRALEELTGKAKLSRYGKGDTVYTAGSMSDYLYIVLEGLCEAVPEDDEQENLTFGMGALFGESGAMQNKCRLNTVVALGDTLLLKLPGESLRNIITDNEKLTTLFEGKKPNQFLYFDSQKKAFLPCQKNLIAFINFTQNSHFEKHIVRIGRFLNRETSKSILLLEFCQEGGEIDLADLGDQITQRDGTIRKGSANSEFPFLNLKIKLGSDERALPYLRPFLEYASREFPYIIAYLPGNNLSQTVETCVGLSNTLYLVLNDSNTDMYAAKKFVQSCAKLETALAKPLLFCKQANVVENEQQISQKIGIPVHAIMRDTPQNLNLPEHEDSEFERTHRFDGQFRRLAREIGKCRIGLALSSGGAKGLAHIGVIQVLEENGIEIDYLAGTSIGSYVASCWARGYSGQVMEKLAMEYNRPFGALRLADPWFSPRLGVLRGEKVRRRLKTIMGDTQFADLSMPVGVVATSLKTLERVIFDSGDVADAVTASCTIPGICRPSKIKGENYVDGGVSDPLPIDVLEEWGIENIIAVSTVPSPDDYRKFHAMRAGETRKNKSLYGTVTSFLNTHLNYFAKGNVFDTLMRSTEASQIRIVARELFRTDIAIQAVDCDAQWHDFAHPKKHIERGRKAAEDQLELIKSLALRKT